MGKKAKRRKAPASVAMSAEQYARLLARGGSASLDTLARYEAAVVADPVTWAEPFGCDGPTMLEAIGQLRAMLLVETMNASVAAVGV